MKKAKKTTFTLHNEHTLFKMNNLRHNPSNVFQVLQVHHVLGVPPQTLKQKVSGQRNALLP